LLTKVRLPKKDHTPLHLSTKIQGIVFTIQTN
jgi:hypothetical protein